MAKKNNKQYGGAIGKAILYNRNVLYFIFFLSLGYLFYILSTYDFYTFSIFVIIGFLTSFFSKNMVVILALAMSVSFIFKYGTNIRPEGFENELNESNESNDEYIPPSNEDPPSESMSSNESMPPPASMPPSKSKSSSSSSSSSDEDKMDKIKKIIDEMKHEKPTMSKK